MDEPDLHPLLAPLAPFLGPWRGAGRGEYPTIEAFDYVEEVRFWHVGKPFLAYEQRTRDARTGAPLHAESGYWRAVGRDEVSGVLAVEVVLAHPSGVAELLAGTADGGRIEVATTAVATTATAKEVTALTRTVVVDGDVLTYDIAMAAVGQPLQHHLRATLHRAG